MSNEIWFLHRLWVCLSMSVVYFLATPAAGHHWWLLPPFNQREPWAGSELVQPANLLRMDLLFPGHERHCRITSFSHCTRLQFPSIARNNNGRLHRLFYFWICITALSSKHAWSLGHYCYNLASVSENILFILLGTHQIMLHYLWLLIMADISSFSWPLVTIIPPPAPDIRGFLLWTRKVLVLLWN